MFRIAVLCIALVSSACGRGEHDKAPPAAAPAKATKDPDAARAAIEKGAVVLDVRTPEEYAGDHLPQATNVPVQELETRLPEVGKLVGDDKAKPVVVYCGTGNRAGKAKSILEAAGYTHVINGGGIDDLH